MPYIKDKKFSYTKEGIAKYKKAKAKKKESSSSMKIYKKRSS